MYILYITALVTLVNDMYKTNDLHLSVSVKV